MAGSNETTPPSGTKLMPKTVRSLKWLDNETLQITEEDGKVWVLTGVKVQWPDVASLVERNPETFEKLYVTAEPFFLPEVKPLSHEEKLAFWEDLISTHINLKDEIRRLALGKRASMDPEECLKNVVELATMLRDTDKCDPECVPGWVEDLAERVLALDEWIRLGGALPKAWQK